MMMKLKNKRNLFYVVFPALDDTRSILRERSGHICGNKNVFDQSAWLSMIEVAFDSFK
jgi:hypothetical protein